VYDLSAWLRQSLPKYLEEPNRMKPFRIPLGRIVAIACLALSVGFLRAGEEPAAPPTGSDDQPSELDVPEGIQLPRRGLSSHRGANRTHPENTLAAFREAIRLGAHQVELDVYLTDHGDLVVIHDTRVDRTTNGTGDIRRMTLAEIKRLDAGGWKDAKFAGERIPTLDEALRIMPHNIWLNLHLKGDRALGAAVARKVLQHGRAYQAFLAAGTEAAAGARQVLPGILICNMDRQNELDAYVDQTIQRGAAFIQLLRQPGTPEQMQRLKKAGVVINLCCVNEPELLAGLLEAGVDFPLADDLHAMMKQAQQLGIEPVQPVYLNQNEN
jgi:glycerophosphoryl diester phosphodiesterase